MARGHTSLSVLWEAARAHDERDVSAGRERRRATRRAAEISRGWPCVRRIATADREAAEANRDNFALRQRMEPLMEVYQHKGDGECMNGFTSPLGAVDEFCDFEKNVE